MASITKFVSDLLNKHQDWWGIPTNSNTQIFNEHCDWYSISRNPDITWDWWNKASQNTWAVDIDIFNSQE